MHKHKMATERGPYGCKGGVAYVQTCSCGCQRTVCDCQQCKSQNQDKTPWEMPICRACGLRHPADECCERGSRLVR